MPPQHLIEQFLSNQARELANHSEEIELRKLNEKNSFAYATKALEAQKQDRKEEREHKASFMKYGFWLTVVILILTALFVAGCMYTDNMSIVVSGLKVLAYMLPGTVGGYFIGLNKGKKSRNVQSVDYPTQESE